jgi:hypothetical protein
VSDLPKGLVSSPQFDVRLFPPGAALFVDATKDRYHKVKGYLQNFKGYALVCEATPLLLKVGYIKIIKTERTTEDDGGDLTRLDKFDIPIDYVAEGVVTVEIIVRKENGGLI